MIPYGRQKITKADINSVVKVLNSDYITQGPTVPLFEAAVARKVEAKYSIAVNSATSALHISCLALGLGKGDYLWTSPNSFVASANCGLYCGASVDFVDIELKDLNIDTLKLEAKLITAERKNTLPKVLVVVHFGGQPCDMKKIFSLAKRYNFKVIEDASHAIGSKYFGKYTGNCSYSDITVFSFHPVKIITTGEGGMALTNDTNLADSIKLLRSHGITRDATTMEEESHGDWYYEQLELGYNYRMTDIQAALGLSQLKKLDKSIECRHDLVNRYCELLDGLPIIKISKTCNSYSSHHLYPVRLNTNKTKKSRFDVFHKLRKLGIGVNIHYIPIHTQPYFKKLGFKTGDYPEAEKYYSQAISLPLFYGMSYKQQDYVIEKLSKVLSNK